MCAFGRTSNKILSWVGKFFAYFPSRETAHFESLYPFLWYFIFLCFLQASMENMFSLTFNKVPLFLFLSLSRQKKLQE